MTEFQVYLWLSLTRIGNMLIFFSIMIMGGYVITKVFISYSNNDDFQKLNPLMLLFFIPLFIGMLLPSTKEYAVIKVFPKISNSKFVEEIKKDVPELYDMAKQAIKVYLTK